MDQTSRCRGIGQPGIRAVPRSSAARRQWRGSCGFFPPLIGSRHAASPGLQDSHRRSFVMCRLLGAFLLFLSLAPALPAAEPDRRPNILFAMADDWAWPHAGVYGDKVVQTPTF